VWDKVAEFSCTEKQQRKGNRRVDSKDGIDGRNQSAVPRSVEPNGELGERTALTAICVEANEGNAGRRRPFVECEGSRIQQC
jgi:hypothetical protein